MKNLFDKMQFNFENWKDPKFILQIFTGISFLNLSLLVNYFSTYQATENAGQPVGDLFFRILPHLDTAFIDRNVSYYISFIIFILVIFYSKKAIQLIYSVSVLILLRSFFINLTYLGIPNGVEPTKSFFTQGGDLFFSGHTALPFLVALIFWQNKFLRYIFLFLSFCMGTEVLLGRYHYSIDVFAAPFMAYCVYVFVVNLLHKYTEIV